MIKFSISQKLALSFVVVIGTFIMVAIFSLNLFAQASRRYEHANTYISQQSRALTNHSEVFSSLDRNMRDTVSNMSWYEASGFLDWAETQEALLSITYQLKEMINTYILITEADTLLAENTRLQVLAVANDLSHNIGCMYQYINSFFDAEAFHCLQAVYYSAENIYSYIYKGEYLVSQLRSKNQEAIDEIRAETSQLVATSVIAIISVIIFCSLFATFIAVRMTINLRRRIEILAKKATAVWSGDFSVDIGMNSSDELGELSNIMDYTIATFKRLHTEISFVTNEIERGNVAVQADDANFLGGYKEIIHAINLLLEKAKAIDDIRAASQAKSQFLASMSHEIRTPLNAILGLAEITLQKPSIDDETRHALENIHISGDMLLGIINDILDLSKIEEGKADIVFKQYDLLSMLNDVLVLNAIRHDELSNIKFEIFIEETTPAFLLGDELRVKQILNNILSNAFKYTDEGLVKLSVRTENDENNADSVILIVIVSDTGHGMSAEQLDVLFETYIRFNADTNRKVEGVGLGMSIVDRLVRLMNGEIHVESELGVGTTFTVRLPQGTAGRRQVGKKASAALGSRQRNSQTRWSKMTQEPMPYGKILIVDDVNMNIYVAKGLLTPYHLQVDSAQSGFAAIEKIKNGNIYDIVFMDHMMPEMDGIEAVMHIRALGYENTIIALTANALAGQESEFLNNGFDGFVSKPVDIRQLNEVLNKFVRDKHLLESTDVTSSAKASAQPLHEDSFHENSDLNALFVIEGSEVSSEIESIIASGITANSEELRAYTVRVHGMRSVLSIMNRKDLADIAEKLERMGRNNDIDAILEQTPAFLDSVRAFVAKVASSTADNPSLSHEEENKK